MTFTIENCRIGAHLNLLLIERGAVIFPMSFWISFDPWNKTTIGYFFYRSLREERLQYDFSKFKKIKSNDQSNIIFVYCVIKKMLQWATLYEYRDANSYKTIKKYLQCAIMKNYVHEIIQFILVLIQ